MKANDKLDEPSSPAVPSYRSWAVLTGWAEVAGRSDHERYDRPAREACDSSLRSTPATGKRLGLQSDGVGKQTAEGNFFRELVAPRIRVALVCGTW